jgi:hypothetical protein
MIALDPRARSITQLRGRLNLMANSIRKGRGGQDPVYAEYVNRGRRVLTMWILGNGLGHKDGVLQGWLG